MTPVNESYPGTRLRAFRINDELYEAAKRGAERRGLSLSEVVRKALEEVADDEGDVSPRAPRAGPAAPRTPPRQPTTPARR